MKRFTLFFAALKVPIDALALFWAFGLSYYIRDEYTIIAPQSISELSQKFQYTATEVILSYDKYLTYLAVIIPVMLVIFAFVGMYNLEDKDSVGKTFWRTVVGVSAGEAFILLLFLLKRDFFMPRSLVLYSWVFGILAVWIANIVLRIIREYAHSRGYGLNYVLIIGKNETANNLASTLCPNAHSRYRIAGQIGGGDTEDIITEISRLNPDEVYVASTALNLQTLIILRNYCQESHIVFNYLPALLFVSPSSLDVHDVGDFPVIEVRPTPLEGWGRIEKRLFDIIMSLLAIIILSPVFLIVMIMSYVTDPGPLIYRHKRVGRGRKIIYVRKFRSMKWEYCTGHGNADANFKKLLDNNPDLADEWNENFKLKNDPRVTKFGNIIRKLNLDELPQFLDVLNGTLSLVGPRPIINDEIEKYGDTARILFTVKPGLTGLWQVSGRNDVSYDERIALDSSYIEHWSLFGDVLILLKTVWMILFKNKGAY